MKTAGEFLKTHWSISEESKMGMFRLKQYLKMLLQNVLLPAVYRICSRHPVRKGRILMADAHHTEIPFSMRRMYEELKKQGKEPELFILDFGKTGFIGLAGFLIRFMKAYATAEYVFICDYFLPASSCRKRPETKLIQLWHSCGLMKKIAFDAGDDVPKNYRGDLFGNYSLLTMSAEVCVPVHAHALRLPQERIRATGISRTDVYFDPDWNERCRRRFAEHHPDAAGKKVLVWAPTFRGNAGNPYLEGLEDIRRLADRLEPDWKVIIKVHPHLEAHGIVSNSDLPTEELFPAADLLITDYSSVMFDYLLYGKPLLLFAPDLSVYEKGRGFYLDYRSMPFRIVEHAEELEQAVRSSREYTEQRKEEISAFCRLYLGACDGHATDRILRAVGLDQ